MAKNKYLKKVFPIKCSGRDVSGKGVLKSPVNATVEVSQGIGEESSISMMVNCKYNTGGGGQRCKASHPKGVDKVGEGVICPYAMDIPYAMDNRH